MDITWQVILTVSAVASALICGLIARDKHRNAIGWMVLGLVFNVVAVLVLAHMKPLEPPTER